MTSRDAFVSYVLDMLLEFGQVEAKAMFGGHGIYRGGIIFAIIVDGALYIKADNENRPLFEERGLHQFSYMKKGKECFMSYYTAPEEALDDKEELYYWAAQGYEAALRAKQTT